MIVLSILQCNIPKQTFPLTLDPGGHLTGLKMTGLLPLNAPGVASHAAS